MKFKIESQIILRPGRERRTQRDANRGRETICCRGLTKGSWQVRGPWMCVCYCVFCVYVCACVSVSVGLGIMDCISLVLSHHNSIGTSVTSLYCYTSCVISFHNHWYCCIYHPATAFI